jgi:hypothetical protein
MDKFELHSHFQGRFVAYGPAEFPDPRDAELDRYVKHLRSGGAAAVAAAGSVATEEGRRVLAAYALRAASRAVREKSEYLLVSALVALTVGGLDQNALEALMIMSLIDDAGCRIGAERELFFADAADLVGHPGSVNVMAWLSRSPEERSPEAMGFGAGEDSSGFRYIFKA